MGVRKLLALLAIAVVAATSPATSNQRSSSDQTKALNLLVRAFDKVSPRNIVAIMRMPGQSPGQFQTVEVQISTDGRQRLTVLQPIQRAGLVILDLGSTRQIYDPDKQTLTIGTSPSADLIEASERVRLVRKNYTLRLYPNITLAGCSATRIDAKSRHSGCGGVSIFIDPRSFFVLRVDGLSPSGERTKRFDTETVDYPESLDPSLFKLELPNVTSEYQTAPVPVKSLAEARRRAGIAPLAPHNLPFGFIVRKTYVRVDPGYNAIGFNISDGLAAATVFEFNASTCPASLRAEMNKRQGDFFQSGDTIVGIVSDLDPQVRAKLLKAFKSVRSRTTKLTENFFRIGSDQLTIVCFGTVSSSPSVA